MPVPGGKPSDKHIHYHELVYSTLFMPLRASLKQFFWDYYRGHLQNMTVRPLIVKQGNCCG